MNIIFTVDTVDVAYENDVPTHANVSMTATPGKNDKLNGDPGAHISMSIKDATLINTLKAVEGKEVTATFVQKRTKA